MTPQEQQMIDGLISRIRNTPVQNKDTEAEQHIQQSLAGSPDAPYILVQTVLVQQYGLQQAQAQINELKQQIQALQDKLEQAAQGARSSGGGSFLSHLFGGAGSSTSSQGQPASQNSFQPVNNPGYSTQSSPGGYPPPPPPQAYAPQAYPGVGGGGLLGGAGGLMGGAGGGGFLRGALQTAAGVAAGEMVFQGMEDLFHGFGGGHGGYERGFGGGGGGETIVNNYYDDDRSGDRGGDRSLGDSGRDDGNFYNPGADASRSDLGGSDLGSNSAGFANTGSNDLSFADTTSSDSFNDTGSFDDTSSFDDSSSGTDDFSGDNS